MKSCSALCLALTAAQAARSDALMQLLSCTSPRLKGWIGGWGRKVLEGSLLMGAGLMWELNWGLPQDWLLVPWVCTMKAGRKLACLKPGLTLRRQSYWNPHLPHLLMQL